MKKFHLIVNGLWVLTTVFVSICAKANDNRLHHQQVLSDFDTLYQSLIDTHYDPYAYISESQFHSHYEAIRKMLSAPSYSMLVAITYYQQLVASLNNGHTEIDFPLAPYLEYAESGGTIFPLDLAIQGGKALVRANYSNDHSISLGTELLSINGQSIEEILRRIHRQISAERLYFKNAKLEVLSFPRYYWYAFGGHDRFSIVVRSGNAKTQHTIDAISVFEGFEERKDEILSAQQTLRFYDVAAYLNPGHFSGDEQQFRNFIDDAFGEISVKNVESLIIDLRNNSGGNDSFSDYLVSYIADKPFSWNSSFKLRTSALLKKDTRKNRDLDNPYWQSIMAHADGQRYPFSFDLHAPVATEKRFTGKVYVLINRHSHSQASVTAAQIQDYGWATMVGEETGDYPTLYASQFQYALPLTGINVKIAKGYIVRVSGKEEKQGVRPDIKIRDHLLDEDDEILEDLLQQLAAAR